MNGNPQFIEELAQLALHSTDHQVNHLQLRPNRQQKLNYKATSSLYLSPLKTLTIFLNSTQTLLSLQLQPS